MSRLLALFVTLLLFIALLLPFAAFSPFSLPLRAAASSDFVTSPTAPLTTPYPILFVTQPPVRADFTTIGNHGASMDGVARGIQRGSPAGLEFSLPPP